MTTKLDVAREVKKHIRLAIYNTSESLLQKYEGKNS